MNDEYNMFRNTVFELLKMGAHAVSNHICSVEDVMQERYEDNCDPYTTAEAVFKVVMRELEILLAHPRPEKPKGKLKKVDK